MKQTQEDRLISEAYCSMNKSENAEDVRVVEGTEAPQSVRVLQALKNRLELYLQNRGARGGQNLKQELIPLLNHLNREGDGVLARSIMQMIQDSEVDDRRTKGMSWAIFAQALVKKLPEFITTRMKQGVAPAGSGAAAPASLSARASSPAGGNSLPPAPKQGVVEGSESDTHGEVENEETTELSNLHKMIMDRPNLKNIKIQTHNGNVDLPIMEMWVQDNGIVISVDHSGLQTP